MKTMCPDYHSLMAVILVSIFGHMLVVVVKDFLENAFIPPSFVDTNYYCESGAQYFSFHGTYYFNDTLWDGAGCVDNCCDNPTQPWFCRQLNEITSDYIEAQICGYDPFYCSAVVIDQLELYIQ